MISSIESQVYDLTGQMNAIALNKINALDESAKIKVYIPKIMANIEKGSPEIKKLQTKGKGVFKNANKKPSLTHTAIIYEKNYFETNLNASSNIDDLSSTSKQLMKEINESIQKLAAVNDLQSVSQSKKMSYIINQNTELRVEFLNGKINRLAFTTMDKTKSGKEFE